MRCGLLHQPSCRPFPTPPPLAPANNQGPYPISQLRTWAQAMKASDEVSDADYRRFLAVHAFTDAMRRERRCMKLAALLQLNAQPGGYPPGTHVFRP